MFPAECSAAGEGICVLCFAHVATEPPIDSILMKIS